METLKLRDSGTEVQSLQELLQRQGLSAPMNGIFDEATKSSVIAFQKANGLDADGIVGYKSWETLFTAGYTPGERLSEADFALVADLLDVEIAALKAVQQVEMGGQGWFFCSGETGYFVRRTYLLGTIEKARHQSGEPSERE
ncbi:MAG: peptidoglycan-binding protein [Bacteroides sp.]|nr:peptidoglycan-binding protein [Bacteroides sp.]